ncbi:MAG: ATP-binding protein [Planctomycetaceae bacterium]|nr:ATP-binding protein [Planctomycetaceae bacterium]
MLALVVTRGPDRGRAFALPEREPQLLGRSSEALHLTDATVSRRHAELTPDNGVWTLRDLESRHGTFVNGVRLAGAVELRPGDRVRLGDTELLAIREGEAAPVTHDDGAVEGSIARSGKVGSGRADGGAGQRGAECEEDGMRAADRISARLVSVAAEPTDADVFLAEAVRELGAALAPAEIVALRAVDARLDEFVAPAHAASSTPHAPLALVRAAIDAGEILAGGIDHALVVVAPFGAIGRARGAFVLRRDDRRSPDLIETTVLARAAEVASLALAARGERDARGTRDRLALIGETVAALSHSIKNMLQGMRFGADSVDLALSRGDLPRAQEGWPVLQRNLDRIHALALNMLAWAKERPLEPEETDANAIVREVRELLAPAAGRRRVGVLLRLDEALPPIRLDAPAVHQALTNLVLNAIEAAPERTGIVELATEYRSDTDELAILVRDNGPGISDAVRARLFEPFVTSKGQRGTGLGLAVARKIAERHGGRLEVGETSRSGTTFVLWLPAGGEGFDPAETRVPQGPKSMRPEDFRWKFE